MVEKLVMFENAVETLGYFSRQLAAYFEKKGYRIFFVDYERLDDSVKLVKRFIRPEVTALLTFNFIGLSKEDYCMETDGRSIWETRGLRCYCIMVDHPLYYYKELCRTRENLTTFCVDRTHVAYMRRFFPEIPCYFLPLAGNLLPESVRRREPLGRPFREREYEIAFIANYVPLPDIATHFRGQTQEYIDFYNEIFTDLRRNPGQQFDTTMERFILREIPEATPAEVASAQAGMLFLDLYIRTFYREQAVRTLADAGFKVHVFGKGWEKLKCANPDNLIQNGRLIDSAACVRVIQNTKIALNVMPWFKDGAHDRIFTAMLNGAVSLTDDSIYLNEILTEWENAVFYHLENMSELAEKARLLLREEDAAAEYAKEAYAFASANHTWENRAGRLEEFF
mgnify:CR=1 FL=1